MEQHPQYSKIADEIAQFIHSDAWRVIKYRVGIEYNEANQSKVNANIRAKNAENASYFLGQMDGAKDALDITERIPREINQGKLAVDVALRVIENKQRKVGI